MTAPEAAVAVARDDGVLRLTKVNAGQDYGISLGVIAGLVEQLTIAGEDPGVAAVLIDVAGLRQFHGGAVMIWEIEPDAEKLDEPLYLRIHALVKSVGDAIVACPRPVVVSARAGALGAGLETMLPADFVYCYADARFSQPEVQVGLVAGGGGTQRLARMMPWRQAQEFLLLGEAIDGRQAEALGLVTRALPRGQAYDDALEALLEKLRRLPRQALAATKRSLNAAWAGPIDAGLEMEREAFLAAAMSGEFTAWKRRRDSGA